MELCWRMLANKMEKKELNTTDAVTSVQKFNAGEHNSSFQAWPTGSLTFGAHPFCTKGWKAQNPNPAELYFGAPQLLLKWPRLHHQLLRNFSLASLQTGPGSRPVLATFHRHVSLRRRMRCRHAGPIHSSDKHTPKGRFVLGVEMWGEKPLLGSCWEHQRPRWQPWGRVRRLKSDVHSLSASLLGAFKGQLAWRIILSLQPHLYLNQNYSCFTHYTANHKKFPVKTPRRFHKLHLATHWTWADKSNHVIGRTHPS